MQSFICKFEAAKHLAWSGRRCSGVESIFSDRSYSIVISSPPCAYITSSSPEVVQRSSIRHRLRDGLLQAASATVAAVAAASSWHSIGFSPLCHTDHDAGTFADATAWQMLLASAATTAATGTTAAAQQMPTQQ
jgi:hypothetical protein